MHNVTETQQRFKFYKKNMRGTSYSKAEQNIAMQSYKKIRNYVFNIFVIIWHF